MKITLITDSTCDLNPTFLKEQNIPFAPLKVLFKEREYIDKIDLTNPEFYALMRESKELPSTSQVNPGEFYDLFAKEIADGNQVLGVFLSSELSGTYNSAVIAKEMVGSENIYLIDSRTVSFALGFMIMRLKEMIDSGAEMDTIIAYAKDMAAHNQLYGMLDSLENLKKGGRLSSGTAMIGKVLNLKPIIEVKEGLVGIAEKARGSRKGMVWMMDQLSVAYPEGKIDAITIAHANAEEKLNEFKQLLLEKFEISKIYELEIGSVVGTHAGEGAIGMTFFRK